ncbi:hypothetical protein [Sorangium sp. So ce362]|uniref:hypothetical protein n=1 Tax=Sorangium sp. So ce362 TaxID=3133303 RepID=UPI003F5FBBE4
MDVDFKIAHSQLLEIIKARFDSTTLPPCSFCGGRAQRNLVGVHWMNVDDDFAYRLSTPAGSPLHEFATAPTPGGPPVEIKGGFGGPVQTNPGVMPCAVFECSACGNIWFLSMHRIGIFSVAGKTTPVLRLIRGGSGDNDVADPKDGANK